MLGLRALNAGQAAKAESLFTDILRRDPGDPSARFNLALAQRLLGKRRSAIQLHEALIRENASDFASWVALGNLHAEVGSHDRAMRHYHQAHKLKPRSARVSYNCAITYEQMQEYAKALEYYDKALQLQPTYYDALCRKATLLEEQGRPEQALQHLKRARGMRFGKTKTGEILYEEGNLLARMGSYRSAIACYEELLKRYPGHPRAGDAADNVEDLRDRIHPE